MVTELLTDEESTREFARLIKAEPLADGTTPEERLVICGVSWERYLAIDRALGDDRPGPRFSYLNEELEIMTTSNEHERIKEWLGEFLGDYFFETGLEVVARGQATMRTPLKVAGAEPDKSWCIGEEKQWPDLVLEIALTSGGVKKLEIYRRFEVPEVWFWRRSGLEIFALRTDASGYDRAEKSALLPGLDLDLLQRCVAIGSWQEARRTFRAGLRPRA